MGGWLSTSLSENASGGSTAPDPYDKWKPSAPDEGDAVLIPVDDSEHAERAFTWYVEHMHKPHNIVRLLYCIDLRYTSSYDVREKKFSDELSQKKRTSEYIVSKYYMALEKTGVAGSVQTFVGNPGEVILDHAIRTNTSAIVMGSRGLSLLHRSILGSVSGYVVNHSKVPVTIIPDN